MFDEEVDQSEVNQLREDVDYCCTQIEKLDDDRFDAMNDFADLLLILIDGEGIPPSIQLQLKERFFPPPTPEQEAALEEMKSKFIEKQKTQP
jgi:hypothetical protein